MRAWDRGEAAQLLRQLSDHEAGSCRQWYWLEIAAEQGKATSSWRTRLMGILLKVLGINACVAILQQGNLPGLEPFAPNLQRWQQHSQQIMLDQLLFLGCALGLGFGLGLLPASLQLLCWLYPLIFLPLYCWRHWPRAKATPHHQPDAPSDEALPGPEAALGLLGIALAAGIQPSHAQQLIQGLKAGNDECGRQLGELIPELSPDATLDRFQHGSTALAAGLIPACVACFCLSVLPSYWGLLLASLLFAGGIYWQHSRQVLLTTTAAWLGCAALGKLRHWL
ncbi:hypothetical protein [Chitinibacter tainanensis]|uniref:hypothetical protein n=1 Tax=Chitinibacter tainanensis TaxID=230667 RepID=UPI0023530670|nr:hypothetical protein [Chitinibacter tainanensis]